MKDALIQYAEIDIDKMSIQELTNLCRTFAPDLEGEQTKGVMMELLFEELVEDKLTGPVFIIDYPIESTPLCKQKRGGDPGIIERFEGFVAGMEICNGYSELNDPIDQRARFERQCAAPREPDEEPPQLDEDFIQALEYGMPPAAGEGIGIDRLVMLFCNAASIRDVILFPLLKPER